MNSLGIESKNNKRIYLAMVLLLLLLHDNLVFTSLVDDSIIKLLIFSIFCLIYFRYIYLNRRININRSLILVILIILVFLNMTINQDFTFGYFYIILLLISAFIISEVISYDSFIESSINVIVFITIYALCCYLLSPLVFYYRSFFYSFSNEADLPFIHLGLAVLVDIEGYYRLFGMFRESGVFQIFLNTAIIMELFLRKGRVRFFKLSVLLAGLILTFSTPGYLATILILISYTFFSKKKISEKEKKSIIAGVMLLVVMLLVLYFSNSTFSDGINNAWTKLTNKESSYLGRTTSIIVELKLWSEKPIFGYGIQEGFELSKTAGMETLGFYMFNTSTITGLLVTFGGIFTLILVLMLLAFSLRLKTNFIGAFLITIGIFIMISSQLMMYNAYFYALLFISIKNMKYRKRIEEKTDSLETALTVGRWHNAETEI